PLCRRRRAHLLGFEQNGACQLVEPAEAPVLSGTLAAVAISAYHAGRCLDVDRASSADGARVQQWTCNGGENQRWKLRGDASRWELVNATSGKCLDGEAMAAGLLGGSLAQRACTGGPGQRWQAVRAGHTFALRASSGLC